MPPLRIERGLCYHGEMHVAVIDGAELVAWVCLVIGFVLIIAGSAFGIMVSRGDLGGTARTAEEARRQLREAGDALTAATSRLDAANKRLGVAREAELSGVRAEVSESIGVDLTEATSDVATSATEAASSAEAAASALEQVAGIVGSLPERVRFAGLLVLVGTVLVSVATIQFGGTSLF